MKRSDPFAGFHPLIARWFLSEVGTPTEVQRQTWPAVAKGDHVLVTAPTGSGKTLTAFLWALNCLMTGAWTAGTTRVLYVSPLKALNNDIRENLIVPLAALKRRFDDSGIAVPRIRVQTRSGDTPQAERRRMLRTPPEILITTPESLNLLLSSRGGQSMLGGIRVVILDEIHGVIDSKRGVHLITAVERLVRLSGEFQRIALSATLRPADVVARFVGGYRMSGPDADPIHTPRPVRIIRSDDPKRYDLTVRFPESVVDRPAGQSIWEPLAGEFIALAAGGKSTLFFTNSRKLCEKITFLMNRESDTPLAFAHHGSLAREIRQAVEHKLKRGDLRALVATSSLEMGIDIGDLDRVVLVQSPQSVAQAVQRIGRAGHRVGGTSRGILFPTHSQDLIEAAVLSEAVIRGDIEEIKPVEAPLDVLAQIIVSMTGTETWDIDALYAHLRCSEPYRRLSRSRFDGVLTMLAGRYEETGIRDLKPRVAVDAALNTVRARRGALWVLYLSGGTIPDRGYYQIRRLESGQRIGELDEEFVWEARPGQSFTLGTQNWTIEKITHNDVLVVPAKKGAVAPPFWLAEEQNRNAHFSRRIGAFLQRADARLDDPKFRLELMERHQLEPSAAEVLLDYLKRQKEATGCSLPHLEHVVVETVKGPPGRTAGEQIILHTFWGGQVNRPYALALKAAFEETWGTSPELFVANDSITLILPTPMAPGDVTDLVTRSSVDRLIRGELERSGLFGARFRESAGRALLLSKPSMNERMPLWVSRLRSQQLLDSVLSFADFPIILETWRTCLNEAFDLPALYRVLEAMDQGTLTRTLVRTSHPSPMAMSTVFRQINLYMYMSDTPRSGKRSAVRDDLLRDVMMSDSLRPRIPRHLSEAFVETRGRLARGYAPDSPDELLEWLKERLVMTAGEWEALLAAVTRDHGLTSAQALLGIEEKLTLVPVADGAPLITASDRSDYVRSRLLDGLPESLADLLKSWLSYQGPVSVETVSRTFGVPFQTARAAMDLLADDGSLIAGALVEKDEGTVYCDQRNMEILLRWFRRAMIPDKDPRPLALLPVFIARHQGLLDPVSGRDDAWHPLDTLSCCPIQAELWESEVFPARIACYERSRLDRLMQDGDMHWVGLPDRRLMFVDSGDPDLAGLERGVGREDIAGLFRDPIGRYDFSALQNASGRSVADCVDLLWDAVWKGLISNDTFAAVRKGIDSKFKAPEVSVDAGRPSGRRRMPGGRSGFSRWKGALPSAGNWFLLPFGDEQNEDAADREERRKERVRTVLDRYGILFRELLARELPAFRWSELFRTLRLMELSGEILTGQFFTDIPGPQFMAPSAFRMLNQPVPDDRVWWINAADPASLCGIDLKPLKRTLPARRPTTHLVYRGSRLLMVSEKHGRALTVTIDPDDSDLYRCLVLFDHLLTRDVRPLKQITVETVNGSSAVAGPYLDRFKTRFHTVSDPKTVTLYKKL
ncbi:ATP-dependent helicase [Desulfatiferula olefinivorans]